MSVVLSRYTNPKFQEHGQVSRQINQKEERLRNFDEMLRESEQAYQILRENSANLLTVLQSETASFREKFRASGHPI